ncbi:MAG: polyprenyl synthetase family protein [Treponema sp.]
MNDIIKRINEEIAKAINEESVNSYLGLSFDAVKTHFIEPCNDMISRGGKRIRPLLVVLCTKLFCGNEEEAYKFSPIIEAIHTASLIHDDIEDASSKRRGKPSVHITYGLDVALNAGSALYFFALSLIERQEVSKQKDLYQLCLNALTRLHIGQAMDIKYHSNYNLEFDDAMYEHLVSLKTGTLFSFAVDVARLFSNKDAIKNFKSFEAVAFNDLGISFQMLDDIKNIASGVKGKEKGDDIVEGKLSFPIVLYLKENPKDKEKIIKLFGQAKKEGISSKAVEECCLLLENSGVVEKGLTIAKDKLDHSLNRLTKVYGTSPYMNVIASIFKDLIIIK